VQSGGTATSTTIGNGGTETVQSGGTATSVSFTGSAGTLDVAQPQDLTGTISNLQIGDVIDFTDTDVTSATVSGSTLTITVSGAATYSYALSGEEANTEPTLQPNGSGGVALTWGPATTTAESIGGPYSGSENAHIALGGLTVSASPNAGDPLSTVLSVASGTIMVGVVSGATITGNGTGSVTIGGNAAAITSALSSASYTGDSNFYGSDTLSMTTTDTVDNRSTGAETATITVTDTTTPSESLGGPYSGNENAAIGLSLSVAASPNTNDQLSTVLSVSHGTLTVGSQTGSSITLTGTEAQLDGELAHASYTAASGYFGSDTLSVTTTDTNDNQMTGVETTGITVNPLAVAPNLSVSAASGNENGGAIALTITASQAEAGLLVSDLLITVSGLAGGSLNHGRSTPMLR
jgi:hypothetical protein